MTGIKKSSVTVFAMIAATLFSKALGMVRSMMTAWTLGDSIEAVAFTAASKIPCAIFDILFSAAIIGCFIPTYNIAKSKGEKEAYEFSSSFLTSALLFSALFSVIGIIFSPQIIYIAAPKISPEAALLASKLLKIMFPMMIFTAGAYTLTGVLQSAGRFILPALISAVSNGFIIIYLIAAKNTFSVYALSAVFLVSWFLQFLTLALPLAAKRKMPRASFGFGNEYLLSSLKSAPKIMAGSWLAPASLLIASFFSSFVSDTTFVAYDYALNVYTIISGVAVYGVGNFVFPSLSRMSAQKDKEGFSIGTKNAVFSIMLIMIPVFCATFSLANEGITLLYARGNFTEELSLVCASSLKILSLAMPAYAISEIFYRAFYADGKTEIPMYSALASLVVAVISDIILIFVFKSGISGICISFVLSQLTHAIILSVCAKKYFPDIFKAAKIKKILNLALSAALCIASMVISEKFIPFFDGIAISVAVFLKIAIVFILGVVVYLLYIFVSGTLPLKYLTEKGGEKRK
ncbi:MAG: murein biosynthesis integral membrane protein MurJ [Eubacteriales bacterium]